MRERRREIAIVPTRVVDLSLDNVGQPTGDVDKSCKLVMYRLGGAGPGPVPLVALQKSPPWNRPGAARTGKPSSLVQTFHDLGVGMALNGTYFGDGHTIGPVLGFDWESQPANQASKCLRRSGYRGLAE